jgi:uncharacterized protein YegP (UPF0339 family)
VAGRNADIVLFKLKGRGTVARFHVSYDETGDCQLTFENDQGELTLVSYQSASPKQLVEDAIELVRSGAFGEATVLIDPTPRPVEKSLEATAPSRPVPRRAGA